MSKHVPVIEMYWKESADTYPFTSLIPKKWYEIRCLIYLKRWCWSKLIMTWRYPFANTIVDIKTGEPIMAYRRGIIFKAPWLRNTSHDEPNM